MFVPEKTSIVEPTGPKDAKIAIVGEAPGAYEVEANEPFVGPAGRLLNTCLKRASIRRSDCYITNVVKERPEKNNINLFIKIKKSTVETTALYDKYEEELLEELNYVRPNVVVACGNIPLWALCRKRSITKWRGSILEARNGLKVIPTIHPSMALRQYTYSHFISLDLKKAARESEYPDIRLPNRNLRILPTYDETISYLQSSNQCRRIGFDIEVVRTQSGWEVSCFAVAKSPTDCMCIPLTYKGQDYFTPDQEVQVWRELATVLENEAVEKVCQNGMFDASFLLNKFGIHTRPVYDTMIGVGIAYPEFPKGLDFITSVYTDEPYYKDEGKQHFKLGGREEDFFIYNAKDAAVCLEALPKILDDLRRLSNLNAFEIQNSLIEPLLYMQYRGIKIDVDGLSKASVRAQEAIDSLREELDKLTGGGLNPESPQQLADYFYIKKKLPPYTKGGRITTDRDALRRLSAKGVEEARLVLDIRKYKKLKSTYYDVTLDEDNRLRCSYNPVGTKSGRLSSSKTIFGTGMNMQNQPKESTRFMVADDGFIFYSIDLAQAENRIVAYCAPEPSLIKAFETGADVHKATASLMFHKPVDEISNEPGSSPIGGGRYSERFWGKKANHSLNYGEGPRKFALINEISVKEGELIYKRYHEAYPGISQCYWTGIQNQLSRDRTLTNLLGRRRLFLGRWGDDLFREAYSYIPQSTVADIVNRFGLLYIYNNQDLFEPVDLLNQVHDSLVFQLPLNIGWLEHAKILGLIKKSLEHQLEAHGRTFYIPADAKVGYNLADMYEFDILPDDPAKTANALEELNNIMKRSGGVE